MIWPSGRDPEVSHMQSKTAWMKTFGPDKHQTQRQEYILALMFLIEGN